MLRMLSQTCALAALLVLGLTGVASANVTIGSTTQPAGSEARSCQGEIIAPENSDPATPFMVPSPSPGSILQWQVNTAGATVGTSISVVILRPAPPLYTIVAVDPQVIPNTNSIATLTPPAPIPVAAGDLIAIYGPNSGFNCYFQHGATPVTDSLISLGPGAPTAGQTRAVDDSSGPGYVENLAATVGPVPTKKKCKKHKKKRSAESAKKKCKKKKKK